MTTNQPPITPTMRSLEHLLESILPGATISRDNQGQIVIYTGLIENENHTLRDLTNADLGIED